MNMKKVLTSILLSFALLACSTDEQAPLGGNDGKIQVSIGQSSTIKSRTSIGDDGHSAVWSDGDKIAVWAESSTGEFALQAESFSLYHREIAHCAQSPFRNAPALPNILQVTL